MKFIVPLVNGEVLTQCLNLNLIIMAQVIVNLKRVQVFESENGCNVNLVFNEQIDGFERKVDDNGTIDFAEAKVSTVSIGRSALIAQLCDVCDDIAAYRGSIDHAFGQKEFGILLRGAALTLERTLHTAGEVYGQDENGTDLAYQRDCYTTEVVGVKLSTWSTQKIDDALTLQFVLISSLGSGDSTPIDIFITYKINITTIMNRRQEFKNIYFHLKKAFGVDSPGWDMIHRHYSPYMFCPENRLDIISEYLTWKSIVPYLKKYNIVYYCGIDEFLDEYKNAIESRVNLD